MSKIGIFAQSLTENVLEITVYGDLITGAAFRSATYVDGVSGDVNRSPGQVRADAEHRIVVAVDVNRVVEADEERRQGPAFIVEPGTAMINDFKR